MTERRTFGGEVRAAAGSRIEGVALRYGDMATLADGRRETIEPGAFGDVRAVPLHLQHDENIRLGECSLTMTPAEVRAACEVSPGIHELVKRGSLGGLSVEFVPVSERAHGDTRIIERAALVGVGLVDRPAYPRSRIEARAAEATIPNAGGPCQCCGDKIHSVTFGPSAWDDVLKAVLGGETNIVATTGTYRAAEILASTQMNTLRLSATAAGLVAALSDDALATPAGEELAGAAKVTPIQIRPLIDFDRSEYEDVDGTRNYFVAWLSALLFKTAPGAWGLGWPLFDPESVDDDDIPPPVTRAIENRRADWWLF